MVDASTKRTLLQRLFRAGLGRNLISIRVEEKGQYALGLTETESKLMLGRYTVLRWTRWHTPYIKAEEN